MTEPVHPSILTKPPWPERLVELNRANQKFGITTPLRLAAYFGNALQETQWLQLMRESHEKTGARGERYYPWNGRGYLQLTWPDNCLKYWEFRGFEMDAEVKMRLRKAGTAANCARDNKSPVDLDKTLPGNNEKWRERIVQPKENEIKVSHYDLVNTAGAYWAWSRAAESADEEGENVRKTLPGPTATFISYEQQPFGKIAATVNVGEMRANFTKVNGLHARFQTFAAAQMVLFVRCSRVRMGRKHIFQSRLYKKGKNIEILYSPLCQCCWPFASAQMRFLKSRNRRRIDMSMVLRKEMVFMLVLMVAVARFSTCAIALTLREKEKLSVKPSGGPLLFTYIFGRKQCGHLQPGQL